MKKKLITFVCTANICRSPMAEALMAHALAQEKEPLKSLKVVSAGVAAWPGEMATQHSVSALQVLGIHIDQHESQPLTSALVDQSLAIFCMTNSHIQAIRSQFPNHPKHIYLMRAFIPILEQKNPEIPDPYGQSFSEYEKCRDQMIEAIPSLIQFLKTLS